MSTTPKVTRWRVDSYHVNIGLGDAAIHILAGEVDGQRPLLDRAVWIDGGAGRKEGLKNFDNLVKQIPITYQIPGGKLQFDAVVCTHWDHDHHGGILKFIDGAKYDTFFKKPLPSTRFYCPEWDIVKASDAKAIKDGKEPWSKEISKYFETIGRDTFLVHNKKHIAIVHEGKPMLGTDIFTGTKPTTTAEKILKLTELFNSTPTIDGRPGMYCIAVSQRVIGKIPPDTFTLEWDSAIWPETYTDTNLASVAAIIAWPKTGRISHYFAGDLGYVGECHIANWLKDYTDKNRIPSMKASHHGARASTPPKMIKCFRPKTIVTSASSGYGHPAWELLIFLDSYADEELAKPGSLLRGPLAFTTYPSWLLGIFKLTEGEDHEFQDFSLQMLGNGDEIKDSQKRKRVQHFSNLMKVTKNTIFEKIIEFIANHKAAKFHYDEDLVFRELACFLFLKSDSLFVDLVTMEGESLLEYHLIQSFDSEFDDNHQDLDGLLHWKVQGSAQTAAPTKVRVVIKKKLDPPPTKVSKKRKNFSPVDPSNSAPILATLKKTKITKQYPKTSAPQLFADFSAMALEDKPAPKAIETIAYTATASDTSAETPKYAYSLWGSRNELEEVKSQSREGRLLQDSEPLDAFVNCLRPAAIRMSDIPTDKGVALAANDSIFQWMQWSLKATAVSIKGTDKSISSLSLKAHKDLVFDTALADDSINAEQTGPTIGSMGLVEGMSNTVMVLGLSPDTAAISWTLKDVNEFFASLSDSDGTRNTGKMPLHPIASTLDRNTWVLRTKDLKGRRNALWFAPFVNYKTSMRLAFSVEPSAPSGPLSLLKKFWPDFVSLKLIDVQLICVHTASMIGESATGTTLSSESSMTVFSSLSATVKDSSGKDVTVELDVSVGLSTSGSISLLVQSTNESNDFGGFITALFAKMFQGSDTSFGASIPDKIKEAIYFRRIRLTLSDNGVSEAGLTVELKANLGKHGPSENVAILLDASYHKGAPGGGLGLTGSLWFPIEPDPKLPLFYFSDYEKFHELKPLTPNAAVSLSILKLLPEDIDVSNFPKNVPQILTEANFTLTPESVAICGTIQSCSAYDPGVGKLPTLNFRKVSLDAEYNWKDGKFSVDFEFRIALTAPLGADFQDSTSSNELIGTFAYDSKTKDWKMAASIQELRLGMMYQLLASDSRDLLYDVLKDIRICDLIVSYNSTDTEKRFEAAGEFVIGDKLSLGLEYSHSSTGKWSFNAEIGEKDNILTPVTLSDIAANVFGKESSMVTGLPDFLGNAKIMGPGSSKPFLKLSVTKSGDDGVVLLLTAGIGKLHATFIQLQTKARKDANEGTVVPPIRYFKLSFSDLEVPSDVPLLSDFKAPFDELGFQWVNSKLDPKDLEVIATIQHPGIATRPPGGASGDPNKKKVPMEAGFHFSVLSAGVTVLDYPIGKARAKPKEVQGSVEIPSDEKSGEGKKKPEQSQELDTQSQKTPLKKSQGPLTISDLQIRYKEDILSIQMDATFAMGPLIFALFGFQIGLEFKEGVNIQSIKLENIHVSIDGLAASFNRPPLTLEGGLIHVKDDKSDIYAGGITIGFVPWLFQAAGFYGKTTKPDSTEMFTSCLVYAILRGPLITLEFATISGITGGFGYNVGINIPQIADVYKFPFLTPPSTDQSIVETLNGMIKPTAGAPRWFFPQDGAMWLAAGLTVSAFEMLAITAVLVAQWSPQIQFHILGLATADIPNSKSPVIFAHVELGFHAAVDVTTGLFSVEAQLSPNSFILDKNCHLTGGFALYYWFKSTQSGTEGDWVFTIGGYHSAYRVPTNYPRPPRLGISWALGDSLSIVGEAYFAITPKACMAGIHIKAVLTLGPLRAWFDAYADFLINYAPFHFQAVGHVSVGVSFEMEVWFVQVHIGVEISATLYLSGPPFAGIVHVDFWVFGFDIAFGDKSKQIGTDAIGLAEFYKIVIEADSKVSGGAVANTGKEAHVYSCLGGLLANGKTEVKETDPWKVRGGPFSFGINAYFAVGSSTVNGASVPAPMDNRKDAIYAKPMQLKNPLTSTLDVKIKQDSAEVHGWKATPTMKSVPSALWGQYDPSHDPSAGAGGNNSIDSLLAADNGCSRLMMGVELKAPEPKISEDTMQPFEVEPAMIENVHKDKDWPLFPTSDQQDPAWSPAAPKPLPKSTDVDKENQWDVVQKTWSKADAKPAVDLWSKYAGFSGKLKSDRPKFLVDRVSDLYLEAPYICVH